MQPLFNKYRSAHGPGEDDNVTSPSLIRQAILSPGALPIWPEYIPVRELSNRLQAIGHYALGLIAFGEEAVSDSEPSCPTVIIPMRQLGDTALAELWIGHSPSLYNQRGNISYSSNDEVLFGILPLPDTGQESLDALSYRAYMKIMDFTQGEGFPHLLRMWNYFFGINEQCSGVGRYQRFCSGRHEAFMKHRAASFERDLPAASAVGVSHRGLWIYFIASRSPGIYIENQRQVSAYHYPPQYGARSPSFSRATLKRFGSEGQLYISGTASIVGHETYHTDDPQAQLDEILRNLQTLLEKAALTHQLKIQDLSGFSSLKVYVRHPQHLKLIKDRLIEVMGNNLSILYLQGDICRTDLLLEIEGVLTVKEAA